MVNTGGVGCYLAAFHICCNGTFLKNFLFGWVFRDVIICFVFQPVCPKTGVFADGSGDLLFSNNGCDGKISVAEPTCYAGGVGAVYRAIYPYSMPVCPAPENSSSHTSSAPATSAICSVVWGHVFFFLSLFYLDQGQTSAIFMVAPLLITVLAVFFLAEKIGVRRIISVIGGFIGALIIIQPHSDIFTPASLLPLCAASFMPAIRF